MKKKFKVRVRHYSENYYTVQYCNYYVIPIWRIPKIWYGYVSFPNISSMTLNLHTYTEAETFAKSLKSIDDVVRLRKIEIDKQSKYKKDRAEYVRLNIPYKIKQIL